MGVSNQFRLTKVVDFIPFGTHSNLFQMDVSDLFSPPVLYRYSERGCVIIYVPESCAHFCFLLLMFSRSKNPMLAL
jgi:hypothetical protein